MNSVFAILLKNIILIVLIVVSVVFIRTINIDYTEIKFLFIGLGIAYCLAACYEAYKLSQLNTTATKFVYFTDGFFTKRFIKVIAFLCCGVVLLYSQSIIKYLSFVCFLIAATEVIVTIWRYTKNLCFIAFDNDLIIISTTKIDTIKANTITKIEERHGLLYIVNKDNKSFTVRTDMMKEKDTFIAHLDIWMKKYDL